jgi:hypothetical protein
LLAFLAMKLIKNGPWLPTLISDARKKASDDNDSVIGRTVAIMDYNYITFQDDKY